MRAPTRFLTCGTTFVRDGVRVGSGERCGEGGVYAVTVITLPAWIACVVPITS
ncbi:hypothetical protein ES5_10712 [Dietzia cinnamea P4]|nr:hypothetical protein ES5_10712 [Dietzia cinnamea P4]